jgi:hypothetical protein
LQVGFDFLFPHGVEGLVISELIGIHLVLGVGVENVFEGRVFGRSFVFLVYIEDFGEFVGIGEGWFFE